MAVLIPAIGSCASRMTNGERRLAERLEQKLDDDYMLWYDVPIGPLQTHPDFVIIHPRRGILILETKDWRIDTVRVASKQSWTVFVDGRRVVDNYRCTTIDEDDLLARAQVAGEGIVRRSGLPDRAKWPTI